METTKIILIAVGVIASLSVIAGIFNLCRMYVNEVNTESENEERFENAKRVADLWGYELILTEASGHSNYVKYNVFKDGVYICWSNSTAETAYELYHETAHKCESYFLAKEKSTERIKKVILDKKIERIKKIKREL